MKIVFFLLWCVVHSFANDELLNILSTKGIPGKVTVEVKDQDNNPVSEAKIRLAFSFSSGKNTIIVDGITDGEGKVTAQANANNKIHIHVEKNGFYSSFTKYSLWQGSSGYETGRWEPWNLSIQITLYKVRNPKKANIKFQSFENLDPKNTYGFIFDDDQLFLVTNTTEHYDLVFRTTGSYYSKETIFRDNWTNRIEFVFLGDGNGVIEKKRNHQSKMKFDYSAPLFDYNSRISYCVINHNAKRIVQKDLPSPTDDYLVFRISRQSENRGVLPQYGIIESWNIGKDWRTGKIGFSISYRLNHDPGDRNIEYN